MTGDHKETGLAGACGRDCSLKIGEAPCASFLLLLSGLKQQILLSYSFTGGQKSRIGLTSLK